MPEPMAEAEPKISFMGESALLLQLEGPMSLEVQRRIWGCAHTLGKRPEVAETGVGVHSVLAILSPEANAEALAEVLPSLWDAADAEEGSGRLIEVPVVFGGRGGIDLSEVAAAHNLSEAEVVERYCAADYTVFALGSQPGFGYLGGLDPSLTTPRRSSPRQRVEEGSVMIGGAQAGVLSRSSPSGWHVIGQTELAFFDPLGDPPALIAPGDRLRFRPAGGET
ncbi:5-oxoprolinase subunit PxpB [Roseovarius sp. SYSU LYC5161]|uniref:5-oxoprolinase subunit PxpB n=1 Tax=Roseovarius halophilus (ex Wu et al. 2025) TaxID=3376060 RepID=UPI00399A336E